MSFLKRNIITALLGWFLFFSMLNVFMVFLPVTVFMKVTQWDRNKTTIRGEIEGYKVRDCAVVKNSFVGWAFISDKWHEVPFTFVNDVSPNSSKPRGFFEKQSFGFWQWSTAPRYGKKIKMTMQHQCDGTIRTTEIGPFTYERP